MTTIDPKVYDGLAAFRLALRRFLAFSEAATSAAGVTAKQYQALLVIKTHPTGGDDDPRLRRSDAVAASRSSSND